MAEMKRDELDDKLDVALAKYAAVEAADGLGRADTCQHASRASAGSGSRLVALGLRAAAVATVVVVAMAWKLDKPSHSDMVSRPSGRHQF